VYVTGSYVLEVRYRSEAQMRCKPDEGIGRRGSDREPGGTTRAVKSQTSKRIITVGSDRKRQAKE